MEQLIEEGIYRKLADAAASAARDAVGWVRTWCQAPVIWNTHRATNLRRGVWTSSRDIYYDWNEDL